MARALVLFFVLLLPYQFAWSAAATYCEHEPDVRQSQHFGHHQHQHEASGETGGKLATDPDCGVCHAGASVLDADLAPGPMLVLTAVAFASEARPLPSALARAPDRPQWLRLP